MRIGVVGCGYWGSKHVRALQSLPDVDQVTVIDPSKEVLRDLRRTFPNVGAASDLKFVLDALDAVVIATPPATHLPLGLQAIDAGKHVLVEKPLATSSQDARRLIGAAASRGVILMVGHTFEYNAAVWELRKLVRSQELGDIHYIDAARLNLGLYQSDVNVIWDLAPHDVSIMNFLLGAQPTSVEAWGARHAHSSLEDVAYVRLSYRDSNVEAHIHVSWLDPCKVRRVTVVGSRQMAVYNDLNTDERIRIFDKGVTLGDSPGAGPRIPLSYRYGSITSPPISFQEPLLLEDQHFIECVLEGRDPQTNGANGLAVVRALEAAEESLRTGQPVQLEPDLVGAEPHAYSVLRR